MASSSRRRQTMAKINRERAVREKRALKAEKKEARKLAAADPQHGEASGVNGETAGVTLPEDLPEGPVAPDWAEGPRA